MSNTASFNQLVTATDELELVEGTTVIVWDDTTGSTFNHLLTKHEAKRLTRNRARTEKQKSYKAGQQRDNARRMNAVHKAGNRNA